MKEELEPLETVIVQIRKLVVYDGHEPCTLKVKTNVVYQAYDFPIYLFTTGIFISLFELVDVCF